MAAARPLPREFYARPTEVVAPELLGKLIVRRGSEPGSEPLVARIVEVEAYLGERDQASHARRGPTPRAAIMFGPPGRLYVYLIYGMYHCMNFVCEPDGQAGAVLIRAAAPLAGIEGDAASVLRGPGRLCRGLGVTLGDKGLDLTDASSGLVVTADATAADPLRIGRSPRIGVDYAGDWAARPLRFYVEGHPAVSGPRTALRTLPAGSGGRSTPAPRRRTSAAGTARPKRR